MLRSKIWYAKKSPSMSCMAAPPVPPVSFAAVRARPGEVLLFPGWVPQCASRPLGGRLRAAAAFNYYLE